ncbi:hypothetical protein [Rhodococcus sp. X156]|uniref:hypothetical protein n=1 Tax=Rhodococcus sp. X156 TaxID=2499145 RepID=UPI0013E3EBD0|nr:hypothetical protein [Rhodococcus sp. X156]
MTELKVPVAVPAEGPPRLDATQLPVCSRHGAPAARRVDLAAKWLPAPGELPDLPASPRWMPLARMGDLAGRMGAATYVQLAGWPLCADCARTRRRWSALTRAVLGLGVVLLLAVVVLRLALGEPVGWLMAPLLGGAALVLLSVLPFSRGSLATLTGTTCTRDTSAVLVQDPHPAFVAALQGDLR